MALVFMLLRGVYTRSLLRTLVMVNFICQHDQAIVCPDIWSNIILGVPVRLFLGEIENDIELVGEQAKLLFLMWVGHIQSTENPNRNKRLSKRELLPDCLELGPCLTLPSDSE